MSSESLPEQRTEMPTDRRMGEIRKEGAVYHSHEAVQVLTLLAGFLMIGSLSYSIQSDMIVVLRKSFALISREEPLSVEDLRSGFIRLLLLVAPEVFILTVVVAAVAVLATMLQTNWNIRAKWIKFQWNWLNPIGGISRIFSINQVIQTGKALVKLMVMLPIGYYALKGLAPRLSMLMHTSISTVMSVAIQGIQSVFWSILYVLIALAIFDFAWGKYRWLRQNKMTKDEVKDERKAIEGDETMRRKMIAKGMQRVYARIQSTVPKAHVIITNPTHYAVALRYERGVDSAPVVVAKGADFIAGRIREIAREHNIPILERKALARALFASTKVGQEVPRELFKAVAEVLAYVYRLKNPFRNSISTGTR